MKNLLLLAGLALPLVAEGVTVTNYITDTLGNPLYTRVVFTPYTPSTVFGGTNVIGISVGVPCTNGVWGTDVLPGWYMVDQGLGQPSIPIFCEYGGGTNNLAHYASAATNPIPTFAYGVSNLEFDWDGPTNNLDFGNNRWFFTATSSCSVTGLLGVLSTTQVQPTVLTISNAADTNIDITITAEGVMFPIGSSSTRTATNHDIEMLWFETVRGRKVLVPRGFH